MKLIFFLLLATSWAAAQVGQEDLSLFDKTRSRTLPLHIWFPTEAKSIPKNGGVQKYSIALVSHGSGGMADKLFWITEPLVKEGYVVVGIDHPGNRTQDNSGQGVMRVWERARDFTFALNELAKNPKFKEKLNFDKVVAVGHSAGGTTVLMLAGGRLSSKKFSQPIPACGISGDPFADKMCAELKLINPKSYQSTLVEANYKDPRVKAVVSLDPGFATSFDPKSFDGKTKILVVAAELLRHPTEANNAKEFQKILPENSFLIWPKSYHMTFLQPCIPGMEKGNPELEVLCQNTEEKMKMQKDTSVKILKFFKDI